MTIQQLTYLLEVYRSGSFSVAAKNLYITQSAISNAIIALEKEINSPIFVRSKKGLVPTARGMDVINNAKRACDCIGNIANPKAPEKTSVRIGCASYSPANAAFIRLLNENRGRNDIEFSFISTRTGDFLEKLLSCELDIALFKNITSYTMNRIENVKKHNLQYEILCVAPAVIAVSPKHPLYSKKEIDISSLSKYKLLESSYSGLSSVKTLAAYAPIRKENTIKIDGKVLQQQVLNEGHVYAIQRMNGQNDPDDQLRYIPIEGLRYTVFYVTNPNRPRTKELDRFITLLKEEAALDNAGIENKLSACLK